MKTCLQLSQIYMHTLPVNLKSFPLTFFLEKHSTNFSRLRMLILKNCCGLLHMNNSDDSPSGLESTPNIFVSGNFIRTIHQPNVDFQNWKIKPKSGWLIFLSNSSIIYWITMIWLFFVNWCNLVFDINIFVSYVRVGSKQNLFPNFQFFS